MDLYHLRVICELTIKGSIGDLRTRREEDSCEYRSGH